MALPELCHWRNGLRPGSYVPARARVKPSLPKYRLSGYERRHHRMTGECNLVPAARHGRSFVEVLSVAKSAPILMAMRTFEGTCSECGQGELVREGAYERAGVRLHWAQWSCGHRWPRKDGERGNWMTRRIPTTSR